jgi:4-amino-4-deoxy-L-arabinose transferase-like glycosyltransferase
MTARWWRIWLAIGFLVAFGLRVVLVMISQGLDSPQRLEANPDAYEYELFAAHVVDGTGYRLDPNKATSQRPPGTSFLLIPVYAVFGHSLVAARLWFCILSALTVPVLMMMGRDLFNPRIGILAGGWLCFTPAHWYYVFHFLSEMPGALAVLLGVWFSWRAAVRGSLRWAIFAGAVWGYAVLIRPNFALTLLFTQLLLLTVWQLRWWLRVRLALAMGATAVLVVAPWLVRNTIVMGKPTVCTLVGGATFYGSNNDVTYYDPAMIGYWYPVNDLDKSAPPEERVTDVYNELDAEQLSNALGKRYLLSHTDRLPTVILHRVLRVLWHYHEYPGNESGEMLLRWSWFIMAPFFLVGLVLVWRQHSLEARFLAPPLVALFVTAVLFYGCSRFRDGLIPLTCLMTAYGVYHLRELCRPWLARIASQARLPQADHIRQ